MLPLALPLEVLQLTPLFPVTGQVFRKSGPQLCTKQLSQVSDCGSRVLKALCGPQVRSSETTSLLTCLLEGPSGAGKTALAATLGLESLFPFVKVISPTQSHCTAIVSLFHASSLEALKKIDITVWMCHR